MPAPLNARLRRLWLNIHLWIGLGAAALLVPISLSGALLVWHDQLDALIHPNRYAVTEGQPLAPSALLAGATGALARGVQPLMVRLPENAGWPATVMAREGRRGERGEAGERGARPRLLTVYLDPPTARVLDVVEFRSSLFGFLHRFHENLTIPEYNGRAIVGWVGVALLVMSLSGIYLWWPRNVGFWRGLAWRRGPALSFNLHHLLGFWISIPLAVVSATGIYLGFPQQGRDLLSSVAPMTPQVRGGFAAPLLRQTSLDIDRALDIALDGVVGSRPAAIFLPTEQRPAWRIDLYVADTEGVMTALVDDRTGTFSKAAAQSGDRIAQWIRWVHEGSHAGAIWQVIVFVCGLLPSVFVVTGFVIWRRSRSAAKLAPRLADVPQAEAAE